MSGRLERYRPSLEAITVRFEGWKDAARVILDGDDFASEGDFASVCEKRKDSFGKPEEPLPVKMCRDLKALHGFSKKEEERWIKITKEINRVYGEIAGVTATRSAHVKAYEAAVTTLLELEMKAIVQDTSKGSGKTRHEIAFAAASAKIGQPPHTTDRKYHIEAFLLTIELRLMLAQIASARISDLPLTSTEHNHPLHRQIRITFVRFLYDSCIKDCEKATSLARSCKALRQEVRVTVVKIRCTFEKVQFDTLEDRRQMSISGKSLEEQARMRENLGEFILGQRAEARKVLSQTRTKYFQDRPVSSREEVNEEQLWFGENCAFRAERAFEAYEDLRKQVLKTDELYQPISPRGEEDIFGAFHFGTSHEVFIQVFLSLTNLHR
jgi:hypothetical protein